MADLVRGCRLDGVASCRSVGVQLGNALAGRPPGDRPWVVALEGELGTGKTTLVRSILGAMGHEGQVPSPTYTLVEHYPLDSADCWHLDMYRLAKKTDVWALGIEDMLMLDRAVLFVEWFCRVAEILPQKDMEIRLTHVRESGRRLELRLESERARALLLP